jgi:hypothetical protein
MLHELQPQRRQTLSLIVYHHRGFLGGRGRAWNRKVARASRCSSVSVVLASTSLGGGIIPRLISQSWSDAIRLWSRLRALAKSEVCIGLPFPPQEGTLNQLPGKRPRGCAFAGQKLGSRANA